MRWYMQLRTCELIDSTDDSGHSMIAKTYLWFFQLFWLSSGMIQSNSLLSFLLITGAYISTVGTYRAAYYKCT